MRVGIPKGLLYCRYHPFLETFFSELGAEVVTSPDTDKSILDEGVKYCIDEACLPVKVFHGHVAVLRNVCDIIVIPRIFQIRKREFICPKFCGLPEMVLNSIPDMPAAITAPLYATSKSKLYEWALEAAEEITTDRMKISRSFHAAIDAQRTAKNGINDKKYKLQIALIGHPYNIYDKFINMNVVQKLNKLGVGVVTEESLGEDLIDQEVKHLFKRPFWTFGRYSYGFAVHSANRGKVHGIIYLSSFGCGIDSVIVELVKEDIGGFPFMVLKLDEHTGEAGLDTRLEAYVDMLERSHDLENNNSTYGQSISSNQSVI